MRRIKKLARILSIVVAIVFLLALGLGAFSLLFLYETQAYGAFNARPGQFPWMVYLSIEDEDGNHTCGGALVDDDFRNVAAVGYHQHRRRR